MGSAKEGIKDSKAGTLIDMERKELVILAIISIALIIRAIPLLHMQFYEPDNYYYFSILQQAHGFSLPKVSAYDGLAPAEMVGLYAPVLLLDTLGFALPYSMYIMTALAAIGIIYLTYAFSKLIFKNEVIGLLAALILALSPANILRTMLTEFRGDTFSSLFTLLVLYFLVKAFEKKDTTNQSNIDISMSTDLPLAFAISFVVLALASWTGGTLTAGIAAMAIVLMALASIKKISNPLEKNIIASVLIVTLIGMLFLLVYSTLNLSSANGSIVINELQHPTSTILILYYGLVLFLSPAIALLMYSSPFLAVAIAVTLLLLIFRKELDNIGVMALMAYFIVLFIPSVYYIRFNALLSVPVAIISAYVVFQLALYIEKNNAKIYEMLKINSKYLIFFFVFLMILEMGMSAIFVANTLSAGDSINATMLNAMAWLKTNTPQNSSVFAFWPDGSVISALANRKVFSDSVAAQYQGIVNAKWYLEGNLSFQDISPNYVYARSLYLNELYSMCYGIDNNSIMNCTQAMYANGTLKASYIPEFERTNLYKLLSCNSIPCNISQNGTTLSLAYFNNTERIYKVLG